MGTILKINNNYCPCLNVCVWCVWCGVWCVMCGVVWCGVCVWCMVRVRVYVCRNDIKLKLKYRIQRPSCASLSPPSWGHEFESRSLHMAFMMDVSGSGYVLLGVSLIFVYHNFYSVIPPHPTQSFVSILFHEPMWWCMSRGRPASLIETIMNLPVSRN